MLHVRLLLCFVAITTFSATFVLAPDCSAASPPCGVGAARMRETPSRLFRTILDALPAADRQRLRGIRLATSNEGEINAMTACTKQKRPIVVLTRGINQLAAALAEARAYDEVHGTHIYDRFVRASASTIHAGKPPPRHASGMEAVRVIHRPLVRPDVSHASLD